METGKHVSSTAPVHINSISAQREKRMDGQVPLTAVYIQTVPAPPPQLLFQTPTIVPRPEAPSIPSLYSKEMLPLLTFHIVGGLPSQRTDSVPASAARPKSAGKHVCPHCGRDCMKPSVLEKHLRCHTGERPYPCTTCGVSFKTQSNLYKHKRTQAHARISYESGQSSQESISSSRDSSTSGSSLDDPIKQPGSMEKDVTDRVADPDAKMQRESNPVLLNKGLQERATASEEEHYPTAGRHVPLQRQEATFFCKRWENNTCKVKSQSHESTDSGFSESGDHNPSPSTIIPPHSMESLMESTQEDPERAHCTPPGGADGEQKSKDNVKEKEQRTLEERISQLISDNSAVVEDKQLENVRPRKTVLSKQGSIDLPMPYTYKDSFHFDMRINKSRNAGLKGPGLYSSVPTQPSTNIEHAALTRSNSLPFSVALLQPEGNNQSLFSQRNYAMGFRRGSSGQLNPTGITTKPVSQQSSTHRHLVRQTAVDCNHATDAVFMGSSVEKASSCDGESGDICAEPISRKLRRQKSQKFAYNKWYMYGGGTFKKLYSTGSTGDSNVVKGRKSSESAQALQKSLSTGCKETTVSAAVSPSSSRATVCSTGGEERGGHLDAGHLKSAPPRVSLQKNLSLTVLPTIEPEMTHKAYAENMNHKGPNADTSLQQCESTFPSNRKKPRTNPKNTEKDPKKQSGPSADCAVKQHTNLSRANHGKIEKCTQICAVFSPTTKTSPLSPNTLATSMPVIARTNSFLPKYQLKLPNATEHDSIPSTPDEQKLTNADHSQSYVHDNQISESESVQPVAPQATSYVQKMMPPRTEITRHSSTLAVSHRPFAGNTVTTTCRHDAQAGVCSTSVHGSFSSPAVKGPPAAVGGTATPSQICQSTVSSRTAQTGSSTNTSSSTSPFDLTAPADQRVFHVHTPDLHICFELISDEQLALIEPQIDRRVGSGGAGDTSLEETRSFGQVHNDTKIGEKTDNQKSVNQTAALSQINTPNSKPSPCISGGQSLETQSKTEQSHSAQATVWGRHPGHTEVQRQPQKHGPDLTSTETSGRAGHVDSSDVSAQSPKSDGSQTSKDHISINLREQRPLPGGKESQGGPVSQTLSGQHKLIIRSPAQGLVNKSSRSSEFKHLDRQHKQINQEGISSHGQDKGENKTVVHESQDPFRIQLAVVGQNTRANAMCGLSINQHQNASGKLQVKSSQSIPEASSDTCVALLKHLKPGCDQLLDQMNSLDVIQAPEGLRPPSDHRPNSGRLDGASVVQRSAQKKQQTQGYAEIPGNPESADKRPKQSKELKGKSVEVKRKNTGVKNNGAEGLEMVSGDTETSGREEVQTQKTMAAGEEDRKTKADPFKNSQLSEPLLSQTKSGMSEYPPQSTHTLNNLNLCASSRERGLSDYPQSQVKINNSYFSGHWKDVGTHHRQTHLCDRIMDDSVKAGGYSTEGVSLAEETCTRDINHEDHQLIPSPPKRGSPAAGNTAACHETSTLGSHEYPGQVSKSTTEITQPLASSAESGDNAVIPTHALHSQHDNQVPNVLAAFQSTYQDSGCGRSEDPNQCHSFLVAAHFHSYQLGPSSALRPVPACTDYLEDTSSSDEEGKLIIEL